MSESTSVVLIVPASEATRLEVSELIRASGFLTQEAGSSVSACRQVAEARPDLVVVDAQLPEIGTLCASIRKPGGATSVPILLWTSVEEPGSVGAWLLEQVEDVLSRSTDRAEARQLVRAWSRVGQQRRRFENQDQHGRVLFEALGVGVCFLDRHGTILQCNPAMATMLDTTIEQLLGADFRARTPFLEALGSRRPLVRAFQSRRRERIEHAWSERWFRIEADPVLDDRDQVSGFVVILTDISAEVERRGQVSSQAAEAAENEQIQQLGRAVRLDQRLVAEEDDAEVASGYDVALRQRASDEFQRAVQIYREVLEHRLELRGYRVQHHDERLIQALGDRLGERNASPRDVVEIHNLALREQCAGARARKAEVYTEEARLVILELMGRLAGSFRNRLVAREASPLESQARGNEVGYE